MHSGAVVTGVNGSLKRASVDTRSERGIGKVSLGTELTDDDDDFETPAEHFGKTKSIRMQKKPRMMKGIRSIKKRTEQPR